MPDKNSKLPLFGGLAAASGASLCCLDPFALVPLGIGGAWISNQ